ncbi:hypothetical protein ACLB2K_028768 [Fragaria x ananassa]
MGLEVKVEVLHKENISPSSPSPHPLRFFSLSVFDQLTPTVYFPLLLFYPNTVQPRDRELNSIDPQSLVVERTKLLKTSLSETLTRFYPFAGRIHDHASICCNDQGAVFVEAKVKCSISRVLEEPDLEFLTELIPKLESTDEGETGYVLLNVQVNFFECGGIAIGFNVSHKMIDAFTLSTFVNSWAATSLGFGTSDHTVFPSHQYVGAASRFPPLDLFKSPPQFGKLAKEKCITKRFVFESSKIAYLKSEAASDAVPNPTRVEVVSALIWKTAMKASSENSDSVRPSSTWLQIVNMRNILAQPSGKNLMGNLLGFFAARSTGGGESKDDLQGLVAAMRKGSEEFKVKYGTKFVSGEDVSKLMNEYWEQMQKDDIECYCSTSWCRFPFCEADFGWGKPLMSVPATVELKNLIMLMDTSDGGGVEARLTLKEEDMAKFEKNEELLAFASLNPTVT